MFALTRSSFVSGHNYTKKGSSNLLKLFCIFTKEFAHYVCSLPMCTITYEEGSEAIWCICWRGASPQIAGKGELAEETNKHGGAKSFGGNSRLWRRDALPASESLRESLGDWLSCKWHLHAEVPPPSNPVISPLQYPSSSSYSSSSSWSFPPPFTYLADSDLVSTPITRVSNFL